MPTEFDKKLAAALRHQRITQTQTRINAIKMLIDKYVIGENYDGDGIASTSGNIVKNAQRQSLWGTKS